MFKAQSGWRQRLVIMGLAGLLLLVGGRKHRRCR